MVACALVVAEASEEGAVAVPGTGVSLSLPAGFVAADTFPGFQSPETGSSIMVTEIPGPYGAVSAGMNAEGLKTQGMTLLSSESVEVAGLSGLLLSATQEVQGRTFQKWLSFFGNDDRTVLVMATFPRASSETMSEALKRSVLSAQWQPPDSEAVSLDGLTFDIKESDQLKVSVRLGNMLLLSKGGARPPLPPDAPILSIGPSLSPVAIDDLEQFAKARIVQTATVEGITVLEGKAIVVAGRPAYELTASGIHDTSRVPLVVWQVVLVKGQHYYLAQGRAVAATAETYIPEFRKIVSSLTFKD
jgi:hypothetical protein